MPQNACFIEGRSVSLFEATHAAAALIARSRLPVFLINACDVAGTRAAIRLAARSGGVIDHSESKGAFRELDVMRSFGKFVVTPSEARKRADTVLLVGSGLTKLWPDMIERLGLAELPRLGLPPQRRQILWLGARGEERALSPRATQTIAAEDDALPNLIAALRARNAQRRVALSASGGDALEAMLEALKDTKFGVIVYSPASLDALAIEMLVGLVADLNKATRFSTISVGGSGNAETSMQTAGWMTGFPIRTGFGRGYPEHDPWRFDFSRMLENGETDLLICISSGQRLPAWPPRIPIVSLGTEHFAGNDVKVQIPVGQHGRDHDGVDFARETQSLAWRPATHATQLPSAAAVLDQIAEGISREAASC
jgi:formylmethanofuran dehydrogenase subunit B